MTVQEIREMRTGGLRSSAYDQIGCAGRVSLPESIGVKDLRSGAGVVEFWISE